VIRPEGRPTSPKAASRGAATLPIRPFVHNRHFFVDPTTADDIRRIARAVTSGKLAPPASVKLAGSLSANPFVYQNQVVAIYGEFQQMNSATQGLFSSNDKTFVVSAIPTARFTQ
jgi:hypothetical protein